MTGSLLELAGSNLLLSLLLALPAYALHRRGRHPALAHLLWVFVLVKAVTPPLLVVPVAMGSTTLAAAATVAPAVDAAATVAAGPMADLLAGSRGAIEAHAAALLALAWIGGSVLVLVVTLRRIRSFSRLLRSVSVPADPEVQALAVEVARELGLRGAPAIEISEARLSPMTWWAGRRLKVILPETLLHRTGGEELRWVIAHELAHVKRQDHLVRWLEWVACVACWWNPVVWWARRNLRRDEEDACDALVLERMQGTAHAYATALLDVAEILTTPASTRAAIMSSGIDAAGSLQHRLERIVAPGSRGHAPRWLAAGLVAAATASLTVGFGSSGGSQAAADAGFEAAAGSGALAPSTSPAAELAGRPDEQRFVQVANVDIGAGTVVSFVGSAHADTYTGTGADETIIGRAGGDVLRGAAGRDVIRGGKGRDTIRGGKGADLLQGGSGGDRIDGGAGRDTIHGGAGDDVVRAWRDGTPDLVDCGAGDGDRALVDSSDSTTGCEVVIVRGAGRSG